MRDPEVVARAQRAAGWLESAQERWRALQDRAETGRRIHESYSRYRGPGAVRYPRSLLIESAIKPDILAVTSQL